METYIEIKYTPDTYNEEYLGNLCNAVRSSQKQLDDKEETLNNGYKIYFKTKKETKAALKGVKKYLNDSWDTNCKTDFNKDGIAWDVLYKDITATLPLKDVDDIKEE
jgi:hypothetical protein